MSNTDKVLHLVRVRTEKGEPLDRVALILAAYAHYPLAFGLPGTRHPDSKRVDSALAKLVSLGRLRIPAPCVYELVPFQEPPASELVPIRWSDEEDQAEDQAEPEAPAPTPPPPAPPAAESELPLSAPLTEAEVQTLRTLTRLPLVSRFQKGTPPTPQDLEALWSLTGPNDPERAKKVLRVGRLLERGYRLLDVSSTNPRFIDCYALHSLHARAAKELTADR